MLSAGATWREPIPVLHSNQLIPTFMQSIFWWHDLGSFRVPTILLPKFWCKQIHLIGYVICAEFGACRLKHLVALGHRLYCACFGVHFQGAAQVLSRGGIWIIISSVSFMSHCLSGRVVSGSLSYLFPLFLFCSSISSACSYQSCSIVFPCFWRFDSVLWAC